MRGLRWSWPGTFVLGSAMMLTAGGCRYAEDVLERQEPEVDPRQVFPAFSLIPQDSTNAVGIADNTGPWSFPPCEGWEGAGDRRLRLGGLFTAEIPPEEGWVQAESPRAVILVHYPSGSSLPSAYLYAEKIDAKGLGADLRPFLQRVDRRFDLPGLSDLFRSPESLDVSGAGPALGTAEAQDAPDTLGPAPSLEDAAADGTAASVEPADGVSSEEAEVEALETLQPGYTSERGSFSGWKWLGTCAPPRPPSGVATEADPPVPDGVPAGGAMKPFLRFGRSLGEWRLQPGAEPVPAFQILATVTLPDRRNYGVHLAIVCTAVPQCAEAPTLSRLLGSIRVTPGTGPESDGWGGDTLRELAEEVGISVSQNQ